jgi:hypothetical protein
VAHARYLAFALLVACSDPAQKPASQPVDVQVKPPAKPPAYTTDAEAWGKFHSKRFNVTMNLPDGKAWKIDDHREPDTVAVHEATKSRLTVRATNEEGLMNRKRCEDRARALGILPDNADKTLMTVEDEVWVGPEAYDSRVWVAIEPGLPGGAVAGHVFLFGSFIRRCLFVHLTTVVPNAKEDEVLATRLAVAKEKMVKAIVLDAPRTTEDAELPREKSPIKR